MDEEQFQKALKQYQAQLTASAKYYEKKRQEKIQNGTYRGRGRPRKVQNGTVKGEVQGV
jgi:hypothetical protein